VGIARGKWLNPTNAEDAMKQAFSRRGSRRWLRCGKSGSIRHAVLSSSSNLTYCGKHGGVWLNDEPLEWSDVCILCARSLARQRD